VIYRTTDHRSLTSDAYEACKQIGVNPESLLAKSREDFQWAQSEPAQVVETRYEHFQQKKKRKLFWYNRWLSREHFQGVRLDSSNARDKKRTVFTWVNAASKFGLRGVPGSQTTCEEPSPQKLR